MQPNSNFLLNMETKDELLSECEKYFEKVMQDFNQNRKGRNLRKYCNDEGIDYKWLSEYKRTYGATKTASATKNIENITKCQLFASHQRFPSLPHGVKA